MGGFTFGGDNKNLAARLLGGNFVQIGGGGGGGEMIKFLKNIIQKHTQVNLKFT